MAATWRNDSGKKNFIDGNGTICLAHVDVDYTCCLDPDDLVEALKELGDLSHLENQHRTKNIL